MDINQSIAQWALNGKTGLSSKHMASIVTGAKGNGYTPADPADLNRCIELVEHEPRVKLHFGAIAESSPRWKLVIDHWDELVAMFWEEVGRNWSNARSAPKTYERMKEIGL